MFRSISNLLDRGNLREEILWNIVKVSVERVMEPLGRRIGREVGRSDLVRKLREFATANLPGVPTQMISTPAGIIAAALIKAPEAFVRFFAKMFGWPEALVARAVQEGVDHLVVSVTEELSAGTLQEDLPGRVEARAGEAMTSVLDRTELVGILDVSGTWHHPNCSVVHQPEVRRTAGSGTRPPEDRVARELVPGARRLSLAEALQLGIDVGHKPTCCRGVDGVREAAMKMPRRLQDALGILQGSSELMEQHVRSLIQAVSSSSDEKLRVQFRKMLNAEFPPIFLREIVLVAIGQPTPEARAKAFVSGLELGLEYKEPSFVDKAANWAKKFAADLLRGEGDALDAVREAAEDVSEEIQERRAEIRSARTPRVVPIARVGRPRPTPLPQGASMWKRLKRFVRSIWQGLVP